MSFREGKSCSNCFSVSRKARHRRNAYQHGAGATRRLLAQVYLRSACVHNKSYLGKDFLADDHFSNEETAKFPERTYFPLDGGRSNQWSKVIDPIGAAAYIAKAAADTISIEDVSFVWQKIACNFSACISDLRTWCHVFFERAQWFRKNNFCKIAFRHTETAKRCHKLR